MRVQTASVQNSPAGLLLFHLLAVAVLSEVAMAQVDFTLLCEETPDQSYQTVAITSNDQFAIATHNEGITAWDLTSRKQVFSVDKNLRDVVFHKAGNRLLFVDTEDDLLLELQCDGPPGDWTVRTLMTEFHNREPLAISPDGRYMALRLKHDSFGILDLVDRTLVFQHKLGDVRHAAFSPQGDWVALAFHRREDAIETYSIPEGKLVGGSASFLASATRLAYSPDAESLSVICEMGNARSVVLLEAERLRPIPGAQFPIYAQLEDCAIDWSANGHYLAVSGVDESRNTIGLYDAKNKRRLVVLRGYPIDMLAVSSNCSRLASVSDREPGVVWWDWQADLRFREAKGIFASHPRLDERKGRRVDLRLRFSPDGQSLALAIPEPNYSGVLKALRATDEPGVRPNLDFSALDHDTAYVFLLDTTSGRITKAMSSKASGLEAENGYIQGAVFESLAFSPDGETLATLFCKYPKSEGHLVLWDVTATRPRVRLLIRKQDDTWHDGWIDLKYAEDGKSLLLLPDNHRKLGVQWFDLATSSLKHTVRGAFADSLLLLPNGRFASGFSTWDYINGDALYRENSSEASSHHPLARSAGETIVGVHKHMQLRRWDLDTLKVTHPYAAHRDMDGIRICALASSPNRQLVATGCADHLIRIWESVTGHLLVNLRGHRSPVDALCFSPDGKTLASASRDGTTRVWDVSDLGTAGQNIEPPELPTRRTFRTAGGATVTVVFDRRAKEEEIAAAIQEVQSELTK